MCLFLVTVVFFQSMVVGAERRKKKNKISFLKLIPGIAKIKSGKYSKGTLLLGSFLGAAAGTFVFNKKGNDWYDQYRESTNPEEVILLRRKSEKNFKKRNLCIVGIFSTWLIHIIDLKFFKSRKGGVKGTVGKNEINIGFYYTF
ncbi:MAG: hypothetical protein GY950_03685 [bacterium]|nr:hypothetical protein [bacterium]